MTMSMSDKQVEQILTDYSKTNPVLTADQAQALWIAIIKMGADKPPKMSDKEAIRVVKNFWENTENNFEDDRFLDALLMVVELAEKGMQ